MKISSKVFVLIIILTITIMSFVVSYINNTDIERSSELRSEAKDMENKLARMEDLRDERIQFDLDKSQSNNLLFLEAENLATEYLYKNDTLSGTERSIYLNQFLNYLTEIIINNNSTYSSEIHNLFQYEIPKLYPGQEQQASLYWKTEDVDGYSYEISYSNWETSNLGEFVLIKDYIVLTYLEIDSSIISV
ncbi:MAG: hypothetical protein ACXAD7_00400, partial [Candidatus Kariarchaeaceae archaeon]